MKPITIFLTIIIGIGFMLSFPQSCTAKQYQASVASNSELRAEIKDILNAPQFKQKDYWGYITRLFRKLLSLFNRSQHKAPNYNLHFGDIFKKIAFGFALLLPVVLLYLFYHFYSRNPLMNPDTTVKIAPENPHIQLETARKLADQGEYRQAIRYLYLEILTHLKNEKLLPGELQYSDYDHLRTLRRKIGYTHPLYLAFQTLLAVFQEKWYGMRSCSREDYFKAYDLLTDIFQETGGYHETK